MSITHQTNPDYVYSPTLDKILENNYYVSVSCGGFGTHFFCLCSDSEIYSTKYSSVQSQFSQWHLSEYKDAWDILGGLITFITTIKVFDNIGNRVTFEEAIINKCIILNNSELMDPEKLNKL